MALEYTLAIEDNLGISKIVDCLASLSEFERDKDGITAPDIMVLVNKSSGLASEVINDEFGFTPAYEVSFRLDKFADLLNLRRNIIQATNKLLQSAHGDIVLLFNGSTVVLLRSNNELFLNNREGFWNEDMLKLIVTPYKFKDIACV